MKFYFYLFIFCSMLNLTQSCVTVNALDDEDENTWGIKEFEEENEEKKKSKFSFNPFD